MEIQIRILDNAAVRWRFTSRGRLLAMDVYATSRDGNAVWVDVTEWGCTRLRQWAFSV